MNENILPYLFYLLLSFSLKVLSQYVDVPVYWQFVDHSIIDKNVIKLQYYE